MFPADGLNSEKSVDKRLAINRLLAHPLITRAKADKRHGAYSVQLGVLKTETTSFCSFLTVI